MNIDFWITLQIILLIILLGLSAFFSGSETALIGLGRIKRKQLVKKKVPRAEIVQRLMTHPDRILITILIGNNLVNIAAAAIATSLAIQFFGNTGVGIATGVMTLLILTFGEITPKAYASHNAARMALKAARPLEIMQRSIYPIVLGLSHMARGISKAFGGEVKSQSNMFATEEEFKIMVSVGSEEGIIEEEEKEMIHSVIEFGDTTVKDVMIPQEEMVCVEVNQTTGDALDLAVDSGYTRIPVYEKTVDHVIGILHVKDLLSFLDQLIEMDQKSREQITVGKMMRLAYHIPETKKLDILLHEMQDKRVHIAIVVDENGNTSGLATLEDLLEEIVGEIFDEYDVQKRIHQERIENRNANKAD